MDFEFTTADRIIFGSGRLNSIGELAIKYGNNAFIITGGPKLNSDRLINILERENISCLTEKIEREPTIDILHMLLETAQQSFPNMIIGIGGGSALDAAKALAVFYNNPGEITDYLEIIGSGKPLVNPGMPLIAIPTTSGTGAEVTKNAVLESSIHQIKVSLRSPYLLPKIAIIDPELTISVPPMMTAFTGLDALTQLIEPYTCINPNPLIDSICLEGIKLISRSLYRVFNKGSDIQAREDMSIASLFSGLALTNAKLGAVHGLAGPLGGEIQAPHGAICACLLPFVMKTNFTAMKERAQSHPVLERYNNIGKILCNDPTANAEDGLQWIQNFCTHTKIPNLSSYGLQETEFDTILDKAIISSSMKGNPIPLTKVELCNILQMSM